MMLLGEVIGTVVASQKCDDLQGAKFLIIDQLDLDGKSMGKYIVAVDAVGAGEGDRVLFVLGSSARITDSTSEKPVDAVIMGIIDSWELFGDRKYEKWSTIK